jgi:hypothetical protein
VPDIFTEFVLQRSHYLQHPRRLLERQRALNFFMIDGSFVWPARYLDRPAQIMLVSTDKVVQDSTRRPHLRLAGQLQLRYLRAGRKAPGSWPLYVVLPHRRVWESLGCGDINAPSSPPPNVDHMGSSQTNSHEQYKT